MSHSDRLIAINKDRLLELVGNGIRPVCTWGFDEICNCHVYIHLCVDGKNCIYTTRSFTADTLQEAHEKAHKLVARLLKGVVYSWDSTREKSDNLG